MNILKSIELKNQTLIDDFDIYGQWYISTNPEVKISGKLSFSNKNMELTTFGSLVEFEDIIYSHTIFGITTSGECVTLFNADGINSTISEQGSEIQVFKPIFFVVGEHFLSTDDLIFDKVKFSSTYLESLLNIPVFNGEQTASTFGFSFTYPDIQQWRIPSIDTTLKTNYHFTSRLSKTKHVSMKHTALLELIPDETQSYSWFMEQLDILLNLFSLFSGQEQFLKEISFINKKETCSVCKVFITQNGFTEVPKHSSLELITLTDTQDKFESYIDEWFKLYKKYHSIYKLYFDTTYNGVYNEWKFLNYTRILEGYHRLKFTESTYCTPLEYENIKNKIQTFIEENITEEHLSPLKKNVQNAISYSYEYSFQKRLSELSRKLDKRLYNQIFKNRDDLDRFFYRVKETRNKMTHPQTEGTKIFQGMDLEAANLRLNILIKILIFVDIGFPPEFLEEKLPHTQVSLLAAKSHFNN